MFAGEELLSTIHDTERLTDLVLGTLAPAERDEAFAHLAECAACSRRHAQITAALGELPLALPRAAPPQGLRARLDASLDHLERFTPFAPRVAALLGLPSHEVRRALHIFEKPELIPATPRPGMRAVPIVAAPEKKGVTAILAWFEAGAVVAEHTHEEEEYILVFEGAFHCDEGRIIRAGEDIVSPIGSCHTTFIEKEQPCSCIIMKTAKPAPA